jgi:hypothetical protein
VDGADHSFHVTKASGTTDSAVMTRIAEQSRQWVERLRA